MAKGEVCKTFMQGFESPPRLHSLLVYPLERLAARTTQMKRELEHKRAAIKERQEQAKEAEAHRPYDVRERVTLLRDLHEEA